MSKFEQFREIEKRLEKRMEGRRENEVTLNHADFKDGKLSNFGYYNLKQQCEYIDYNDDIEIFLPQKYESNFKETLESMAANELSHIKKDRRETFIKGLFSLFVGALFYFVGYFLAPSNMLRELAIIATWVFVWTAIEKWFFDQGRLRERKLGLYQILAAKVITKEADEI